MKVIESLFGAYEYIDQVLEEAGMIKGQFLTSAQIRESETPIFWRNSVTSKDASDKETYVVYQIHKLDPMVHGDGQTMVRRFTGDIYVYTRSRGNQDMLGAIENKCIENGISFELRNAGYDTSSQKNYYVFEINSVIQRTV